jgi:hypothetical protein
VDWVCIPKYQKLSEEFRMKHSLKVSENNWLYTDSETKLNAVKETGLYTIEYGFVIAYKGIRSDNYSNFNFQYQYFPEQEYESHADFNLNNENSFGLSAWTKERAKEYCNQKIIKVRIHPDDLAALVHQGYKLRCTKFYVVEEM